MFGEGDLIFKMGERWWRSSHFKDKLNKGVAYETCNTCWIASFIATQQI